MLYDIARIPEDTLTKLWESANDSSMVTVTRSGSTLLDLLPYFNDQAALVGSSRLRVHFMCSDQDQ